jgi:hypothetical protein
MERIAKSACELTVEDFECYLVWEYILDAEEDYPDESWVTPVNNLPVSSLDNRIVGTQVRLNNGTRRWAIMSNIYLDNSRETAQLMSMGIYDRNECFPLARYFDVDFERRGPDKLAEFLDLPLDQVFPMSYDISDVAIGLSEVLRGTIYSNSKPQEDS